MIAIRPWKKSSMPMMIMSHPANPIHPAQVLLRAIACSFRAVDPAQMMESEPDAPRRDDARTERVPARQRLLVAVIVGEAECPLHVHVAFERRLHRGQLDAVGCGDVD